MSTEPELDLNPSTPLRRLVALGFSLSPSVLSPCLCSYLFFSCSFFLFFSNYCGPRTRMDEKIFNSYEEFLPGGC